MSIIVTYYIITTYLQYSVITMSQEKPFSEMFSSQYFLIKKQKISFLSKFFSGALKEKTTFRSTVLRKKKEEGTMYGLLKPFRL